MVNKDLLCHTENSAQCYVKIKFYFYKYSIYLIIKKRRGGVEKRRGSNNSRGED